MVDKNIKYYWCRTRVKGKKLLRKTEQLNESAEAESSGFALTNEALEPALANLGISTAADVESQKTEAGLGCLGALDTKGR